ncbi:MAG: NAD(P)-dependent oxidoreductase [Kordiimonadaceae bacterium]|nr:NAD(P)-dependent oxidoreductase [Kordiimonadaceae bacterium]
MKKIALTGATGFVGGHLLKDMLARGYHVSALTRRPQQQIDNVKWINADLGDQSALIELCKDADIIINVAGLVKAMNKQDFLEANSVSVSNLLNAINPDCKPKHFIQISSLAAREPHLSDYAFSKFMGEEAIKNNSLSLNWTIIRPPGIYGPGDTETLKIFKMLKSGLAIFPANRNNRVSWIHVSDLVNSIISTFENNQFFNQILEIGDGQQGGYTHEYFYNTAASIMQVSPIKITSPKFLLKSTGHLNSISGRIFGYPPMLSAKKVNEICHPDWVCNPLMEFPIDKNKIRYDLEEGLKQTLDWYKKNEYI